MQSVLWYKNRLLRMSMQEVGFRIRRSLAESMRRGLGPLHRPVPPIDLKLVRTEPEVGCLGEDNPVSTDDMLAAAERILDGKRDIFRLRGLRVGSTPEWNRDPSTGILAPLHYGPTMDYRDTALVGDIKYTWELNRHLELATLAQAYRTTGNERYGGAIARFLGSWFEQCPYARGVNWCSSLELGIRIINWAVTWQLVGGWSSPLFRGPAGQEFRKRWLESVYRHLAFIKARPSRFSSANNHLIGELAGLFVGSCCWPFWRDVRKWGENAGRLLQHEADAQNTDDGVNREQAIGYQQFVLDFLLISGLVAERSGRAFDAPYWQKIEKMMEFMAAIMDAAGNVPMIGDADDGRVVMLSHEPAFSPFRSLLATGAVLFDRSDFAGKAGECDQKTCWLLGAERASGMYALLARDGSENRVPRAFTEGGYYILGSDLNEPREIRVIADVGPLGYLSIAAHGHADALHFTLNVDGREILVDPGTYAYHTQRHWRDYFRGTSAHNTVVVDGLDQSVSGGPFMWSEHATSRCEEWECGPRTETLVGSHDGYCRLPDPVRHRRRLTLDKPTRRLIIEDHLECFGVHEVERWWHFAEHCKVEIIPSGLVIRNGETVVVMRVTEQADITTYCGDEARPAGWISRGYDLKTPITSVRCRSSISGATHLKTEIECGALKEARPAGTDGVQDTLVMPRV